MNPAWWSWPLIGVALCLELFLVGLVLAGVPSPAAWLVLVPAHAGACALFGLMLHGLLPQRYKEQRQSAVLFLGLIAFFVPLLGALALLVSLIYGLYWPEHERVEPWFQVGVPDLPHKPFLVSPRPPADGALMGLLRHARDPDKRLAAVMTLRQIQERSAIDILRTALKDPVDEVRLLAYSMLDRKEQVVNEHIKRLLERASGATGRKLVNLHRQLAHQYWELSYLGLARGEVQSYILEAAQKYAEEVLSPGPGDPGAPDGSSDHPGVRLLLGRILLRRGKLAEAQRALGAARSLGIDPTKVLPYLAEAAFLGRDFRAVRRHMQGLDPLSCHTQPLLSALSAHWLPGRPAGSGT